MSDSQPKFITIKQLTDLSGYSAQTLFKRVKQGRLTPHNHQKGETLRFTVEEAERFIGRPITSQEVQP